MGMLLGISLNIFIGAMPWYTGLIIGQVKEKFPGVQHYADAVGLVLGTPGYKIASGMFILLLVLLLGLHTLTGTIAFNRLVGDDEVCRLGYGAVSVAILFILALPPSFKQFAILGYIDLASILAAIFVVTIAAGVHAFKLPGGASTVDWTWLLPPEMTFQSFCLGATNTIFAYTFAVAMLTFMNEMRDVKEHRKAVGAVVIIQTTIYAATGAMIYAWVGKGVQSPALLSAEEPCSKVAFGLALPVIYISGSINSNVVGVYIFDRYWPGLRERRDRKFWIRWTSVLAVITVSSWVIAASVPFFDALLALISSLFTSGFKFYFPGLFWIFLIKEGKWYHSWSNIGHTILNILALMIGIMVLVCGTYVGVLQIMKEYNGGMRTPFSCSSMDYRQEANAQARFL